MKNFRRGKREGENDGDGRGRRKMKERRERKGDKRRVMEGMGKGK